MRSHAWPAVLGVVLIGAAAGMCQASLLAEVLKDVAKEIPEARQAGLRGRIAYIHQGNIWVMRPDGSGLQRLTTSGECSRPAWSDNGKYIVYIRTSNRHEHLWVLNVPQRSARRLTPSAGDYECPRWSPDGQWVAYIVLHGEQPYQIWRGRLEKRSVDGKKAVVLINDLSAGGSLAWSPDGTRILFSEGGEDQRISIADAVKGGHLKDGLYRHPERSTSASFSGLHWTDDGEDAVFVETSEQGGVSYTVRRLDLSTGRARELYADRSASQVFTMSCDASGREIWLGTPYPRYAQIKGISHLVGGRLERVSDEGGDPSYTGSLD